MRDNTLRAAGYARKLPGLDCGLCGYKTCRGFAGLLVKSPDELVRCVHVRGGPEQEKRGSVVFPRARGGSGKRAKYADCLGRKFDFILEKYPDDPGPRETIKPHNPALIARLRVKKGDILIGRPMGNGCPVTHSGVVVESDARNGVIVWCVTGPLLPRLARHKDLGYYTVQAFEGMVKETRKKLKIGMRYFFKPSLCMVEWRHNGLVNFLNKTRDGLQVRIEGGILG